MTILQINSVVNFGSTGRIAEDIGSLAIDNDWESYIAYGRYDRASRSQKIKIGTDFNKYWHILQTRLFDRHGFASKRATEEFIRKIEKLNFDIIHLHNLHGYYLNIEVLFNYLKGKNLPIVWTLHDCWSFTGHCTHYMSVDCKKWKTLCYDCPLSQSYPKSYIDRSTYNFKLKKSLFLSINNLTIITPSKWLKREVEQSYLGKYNCEVINNGIDLDIFKPLKSHSYMEKFNIASEQFVLLGVASPWDVRKGLQDFVQFSKSLEKDEIMILVGVSKRQIKELPDNIITIERTERVEDLAQIYSRSDVFLNLTYEDNFPTTNLEALACGTPVITYNTGGSPESVTEDTGFVVEKGDFIELRRSINIIKSNNLPYLNNCRNRALNHYNKRKKYQDYLNIYNSLVLTEK